MTRAEFFETVRKWVVIASGNGPNADMASRKICAAADELVTSSVQEDLFASTGPGPGRSQDTVSRADILFRIRTVKGELAGLIQNRQPRA